MFLSLSLVQTVTHLCNTTYTVSYSLVLAYQVLNIKRVLGNSWHTFFSFVFVSQTPADADVVVVVVVDYCTHCTSRSTHDSILRTYLYFTACAPQVNGSISSSPLLLPLLAPPGSIFPIKRLPPACTEIKLEFPPVVYLFLNFSSPPPRLLLLLFYCVFFLKVEEEEEKTLFPSFYYPLVSCCTCCSSCQFLPRYLFFLLQPRPIPDHAPSPFRLNSATVTSL